MKINVLTNNSCPNSKAFNCPLLASRPYFKAKGFDLNFRWKISEKAYDCDVLFINSNVFRTFWKSDSYKIFKFLESARTRNLKILWFDTTDSTWCTQFEAMPYVDLFLKSQVFKDRRKYLERFRTGRIFTDYFDGLYGTAEKEENFPLPKENDLSKIGICLECKEDLPISGVWDLEIQLFDKNEKIIRRGRVIWSKNIEPDFYISGIAFDS